MLSKDQAIAIVDKANFSEIIEKCVMQHPEAQGYNSFCCLDLDSGEIEFHTLSSSTSFQSKNYVVLYSIDSEGLNSFSDEDIAGDDEIPSGGVTNFPDYWDRVVNAAQFYAMEGTDEKSEVYNQIDAFYQQREIQEYYNSEDYK